MRVALENLHRDHERLLTWLYPVLVIVTFVSQECFAARVYLSESSTSPSIVNPTLQLDASDSTSLFVWVATDNEATINGLGLSLRAADPTVVSVTNHSIFNPTNTTLGIERWNAVGGGLTNQGNVLVSNSNAVSISGSTGLNSTPTVFEGDPFAFVEGPVTAYLHSQVDMVAEAAGQTDLFLQVGQALITVGDSAAENLQFGAGDVPGVSGALAGATDSIADATIVVSAAAVFGDYNENGVVDAADYTVWRDTLGQSGPDLPADGDGSGTIDGDDYDFWKTHFLEFTGSGSNQILAVPEPATLAILLVGLVMMSPCLRGRQLKTANIRPAAESTE